MTATEASRRFSDLLDAIEAGESVTVTRGNKPVAEIRPVQPKTGRGLRVGLAGIPAPDDEFAATIAEATGLVTEEVPDPWGGG